MKITTICPGCRTPWHVEPSLRGQRMRCPNGSCREVFEVREAPAVSPPAPANAPRPAEPPVSPAAPVRPGAMAGSVGEMVPILAAEQVGGPPVTAPGGRPASPPGRAPIPMAEVVESPPLPPIAPDPIAVLRERNAADGIQIDAQTSKPGWLGERLDLGYAIDVLHPAATGERAMLR